MKHVLEKLPIRIVGLSLFVFLCLPGIVFGQEAQYVAQQAVFYQGEVTGVLEEKTVKDDFLGLSFFQQMVEVQIADKAYEGDNPVYLQYELGADEMQSTLTVGSRVVIGSQAFPDGETQLFISDVYRLRGLWWLGALFLALAVMFAGVYGIRAFLGLILSFAIIFGMFVPQVIAGANPFFLAIGITVLIAATTIFLAHGYSKRSRVAFFSILLTVLISIGLAQLVVHGLHLTGVGSEEAFLLQFSALGSISLKGLLLGGIVISVLGVLDDVTTAQAAAIEEIAKADSSLKFTELYKRGMSVGREHIVSLINTLVLAYTGASLPLLLLFQLQDRPLWVVMNSEIIIEEVARMIVGSIVLLLAVPITSALAARAFGKK